MQFFLPMKPPTVTHHAKELHAYMKGGRARSCRYTWSMSTEVRKNETD